MKRILAYISAIALLLSFACCTPYKSTYRATLLIRSQGGDHCEARFGSLEGTLVLNAKVPSNRDEGAIHYDAELAEGEMSVYYDVGNGKELLFTIKGGEELNNRGGYVEKGNKVTVIIETVGTAKDGEIKISFD